MTSISSVSAATSPLSPALSLSNRCALCRNGLKSGEGDDIGLGVCARCKSQRPRQIEARLGISFGKPPPFTARDHELIARLAGEMSIDSLLALLNSRLDYESSRSPRHTIDQLRRAIQRSAAS